MPDIKAILFDNDGVLAHTEETWFKANKAVLSELGVSYTESDFILHTFIEGWGSLEWLRRNGFDEQLISTFTQRRNRLWKEMISQKAVTESSAFNVLSELKKKYLLGVVTNTQREDFLQIHTDKTLVEMLDIMVLREDYKRSKPEPDAYLAAIKKLNLPAENILVVEDSPRGIQAAKAAGARVTAIRNPAFRPLDTSKADFHVETLGALPALIEEISSTR